MKGRNIFLYESIDDLVFDLLKENSGKIRGLKTKLSTFMGCQPAYLSKVIKGESRLSNEQINQLCKFFYLSEIETEYTIILNLENRAGTKELKEFFSKKINELRKVNLKVEKKVENSANKIISDQVKTVYCSSWEYSAIHSLVAIEKKINTLQISQTIKLPHQRVINILRFLESSDLITLNNDIASLSTKNLHFYSEDIHLVNFQKNWRLKTIERINEKNGNDLAYTSVVTISKNDFNEIKNIFLNAIEKTRSIVKDSKSEILCNYTIDFYNLLDN